jgi:hypothetical protein
LDIRNRPFGLDSIAGIIWPESTDWGPLLWTGTDGSEFRLTGGALYCPSEEAHQGPNGGPRDYLSWVLQRPDGFYQTGGLSLNISCELEGSNAIRFTNQDTGETSVVLVWEDDQGCAHTDKALPSEQALRAVLVGEESPLPSEVTLPDPMPRGFYRDEVCDLNPCAYSWGFSCQ